MVDLSVGLGGVVRATAVFHGALSQVSCTDSLVVKDPISDAGGPRFESHTGRVTGKPTPSDSSDSRAVVLQPNPTSWFTLELLSPCVVLGKQMLDMFEKCLDCKRFFKMVSKC